jgi:hypothetical protein
MKWSKSLILLSSASYFGAILLTLFGYPLMANMNSLNQVLYYFGGLSGCLLALKYERVGHIFAIAYGIIAIASFSGVQVWMNYDSEMNLGPYMAAWDLALGVALLDGFEFPL